MRGENTGFHELLHHARHRQTHATGKIAHGNNRREFDVGFCRSGFARTHGGLAHQLVTQSLTARILEPLLVNLIRRTIVHLDGARADIKAKLRQFCEELLRSDTKATSQFCYVHAAEFRLD